MDKFEVRRLFNYDSETGILTNKINRHKNNSGDVRVYLNNNGYLKINANNKMHLAHRICFLNYHGYLPEFIDHINGIRTDNRIKNLRPCTFSQNRQNSKKYRNNTSGIKGVSWEKSIRMWHTTIKSNNKRYFLGFFYDKEVAAQIVRIKRLELHGEFANHGE